MVHLKLILALHTDMLLMQFLQPKTWSCQCFKIGITKSMHLSVELFLLKKVQLIKVVEVCADWFLGRIHKICKQIHTNVSSLLPCPVGSRHIAWHLHQTLDRATQHHFYMRWSTSLSFNLAYFFCKYVQLLSIPCTISVAIYRNSIIVCYFHPIHTILNIGNAHLYSQSNINTIIEPPPADTLKNGAANQ